MAVFGRGSGIFARTDIWGNTKYDSQGRQGLCLGCSRTDPGTIRDNRKKIGLCEKFFTKASYLFHRELLRVTGFNFGLNLRPGYDLNCMKLY